LYQLSKPTGHWHDKELHLSKAAMDAIVLTAGKVVRLPIFQHKLEALPTALRHVSQHLRPG
jgi:hypothetical protein